MSTGNGTARASKADWIVLAMLAGSLATNLVLGVALLRVVRTGVPDPEPTTAAVAEGTRIHGFVAQRVGGQVEGVDFAKPTILYVFRPSCEWCTRNLANLRAILAGVESRYRVVGLSLDPNLGDYLHRNGLDGLEVFTEPNVDAVTELRLGATPQMIVIAPGGTVVRSWTGALGGIVGKEVEAFLGVSLPGVAPQ
jgi:hypothetical protein